MAIARGAGTEIIRSAHFGNVTNSAKTMIVGEQHHIYTILSIQVCAVAVATAGNYIHAYIQGYDSTAAVVNNTIHLFFQEMNALQTFVWNDKFSFNGWQPVDFAVNLDATKQNAIADQAGVAYQYLALDTEGADNMDVHITYIDQNNA